jgi:hypothetical protein
MGGSGMQDTMGGLQTVSGAALLATGNPAGAPMMMNGVSQLSSSGQPGGQQQSPLGGASSLGPLMQLFQGQQQQPKPMAQPAQRPPTPPMQAPALPQAPAPPQMPNANPLMALYQKLMGGQALG